MGKIIINIVLIFYNDNYFETEKNTKKTIIETDGVQEMKWKLRSQYGPSGARTLTTKGLIEFASTQL